MGLFDLLDDLRFKAEMAFDDLMFNAEMAIDDLSLAIDSLLDIPPTSSLKPNNEEPKPNNDGPKPVAVLQTERKTKKGVEKMKDKITSANSNKLSSDKLKKLISEAQNYIEPKQ